MNFSRESLGHALATTALHALALLFAAGHVRAQTPTPTPDPPARTGRSYEMPGAPPRRAAPSAPQQPSPVAFEDVTARSGIGFRHAASPTSRKYLPETMGGGVALFDYDADGRLDIYFTNGAALRDPMPKDAPPDKRDPRFWNRLYRQKPDGTFEDTTERAGLRGEGYSMGAAAADYDADGLVDVFVTALSNETYPLFRNNGDDSFTYATQTSGVGQVTLAFSGWGARFIDADNDGLRDLVVAQGHVLDTIEKTSGWLTYRQPPLLMRNTGRGFVNVSATAGPVFSTPLAARGAAFGDLDNDGDPDLVLAQTDGPPAVLRNGGTKNHWLGVALAGAKGNRQGLGARVAVTDASGRRQIFDVTTAGSYLSSNDPRLLVGLGASNAVRSVEVRWPSGRTQTVENPTIDRYLMITEK